MKILKWRDMMSVLGSMIKQYNSALQRKSLTCQYSTIIKESATLNWYASKNIINILETK